MIVAHVRPRVSHFMIYAFLFSSIRAEWVSTYKLVFWHLQEHNLPANCGELVCSMCQLKTTDSKLISESGLRFML